VTEHDTGVSTLQATAAGLNQLFARQMIATPDRLAVSNERAQLTYDELRTSSHAVAAALIEHGVRSEELVGIFLDRSAGTVSALLGVWFSGGAYVPLDPDYPADRIRYMVEDSGLDIVLTSRELADQLSWFTGSVVVLEDVLDSPPAGGRSREIPAADVPDELAYVIYTSGSTGAPKGVEVPRSAVSNFLTSMAHTPGITADDVLVAVTTLSFDIAALELFLPLTVGACTHVAGRDVVTDGERLAETLRSTKATMMQATPSTWRLLLDARWRASGDFKVLCGGEALPPDLARALTAVAPEVWNMYGPTETTIWSTCYRLPEGGEPVLIGRPIDRTTVYVLDRSMRPVPPGVQGEIWIGGTGLARGYRNQPDRTREVFVPDPFDQRQEARLYRTGDLGRYLADGNLECRGRVDNQVKVRGFRIELGEIEAVLAEHETVREVAVTVDRARPDDPRIVAYTVSPPGVRADAAELRGYLRERIPAHMVPHFFVALEAMPLTANRKIDRKRLPAVDRTSSEGFDAPITPPRTSTEADVIAVWQEVLQLDGVGADADFFELGGHSVLAIRVVALLQRQLGVPLTLRHFFEAPQVRALARRVDELRAEDDASPADDAREVMVF